MTRVQPDPWGPWAAQLAAAIRALGVDFEPTQLQPLCPRALETAALEHHLQRVTNATAHGSHSRNTTSMCAGQPAQTATARHAGCCAALRPRSRAERSLKAP